jgi:hypothetical protein
MYSMKSRWLQFLAEILALLFVFDRCATANNAGCVFEHIEFANSQGCFPSAVTIPPSTAYANSGVLGTLGGPFLKGADDSHRSGKNGNVLNLYPGALIPIRHRAQNYNGDPLSILFRMIFMPKGPRHSSLRH